MEFEGRMYVALNGRWRAATLCCGRQSQRHMSMSTSYLQNIGFSGHNDLAAGHKILAALKVIFKLTCGQDFEFLLEISFVSLFSFFFFFGIGSWSLCTGIHHYLPGAIKHRPTVTCLECQMFDFLRLQILLDLEVTWALSNSSSFPPSNFQQVEMLCISYLFVYIDMYVCMHVCMCGSLTGDG